MEPEDVATNLTTGLSRCEIGMIKHKGLITRNGNLKGVDPLWPGW